ncbi:MAG: OmpA family protein [Saprospiraceae bacterium]|nr:OmpA family protein [Saprospiraceae bacterium]
MILNYQIHIILLFLMLPAALSAQVVASILANGSFEGIPRHSVPPGSWSNCGFLTESPPDVQPSGAWEVFRPAYHGYTYLGMVTRENDTWEAVGQRLSTPLIAGQCYSFSLYMCMSSEYWSQVVPDSVRSREEDLSGLPKKNFNRPIKLRIWSSDMSCNRVELLAESPTVTNTYWEKYSFRFKPKKKVTHFILEAFYKTPTLFPYNGNILIDHASTIVPISCDQEEEPVEAPIVQFLQPIEKIDRRLHKVKVDATIQNIESKDQITFKVNDQLIRVFDFDARTSSFSTLLTLREGKNNLSLHAENEAGQDDDETSVYIAETIASQEPPGPRSTPASTPTPPKEDFRILTDLNTNTLKTGQIIRVDSLFFQADSSRIAKNSHSVLQEVIRFLEEHPQVVIEVGGHTNNKPAHNFCDQLSTARARAVATYISNKGIPAERIKYKGYGKRRPIASNETLEGRNRNQRVEIKILSTTGS